MRIRLSFLTGFVLDALPGWRETLSLPVAERLKALSDPQVRRGLDERAHSPEAGVLANLARWERLTIAEAFSDETRPLEGRRIGDVAEEQGKKPFDALLDVVVSDGLRTGLRPEMGREPEETWKARAEVWRDGRAVVGASDAGAHLDMMCCASYSTFLVGEAVRDRGLLTIEEAVRELTDVPARLYGVKERGRLVPGWHADVVVFDPATVGACEERTRDDLPGGASRIVAEARGVEHVLVNGTEIVRGGSFSGATPGRVLRSGRDTETVRAAS
jgi:N-acyl-D-aspartate/D-glutamate deacylase